MVNGGYIEKLLLARLLMAAFLQIITKYIKLKGGGNISRKVSCIDRKFLSSLYSKLLI